MRYARLLAKSSDDPEQPAPAETLSGHLHEVGRVASKIADSRGDQMLAALGLDTAEWGGPLAAATVRAAVLHDIGKANDHFQSMIRRRSRLPQALRHEVVGLWIIATCPELDRWLFDGTAGYVRYAALRAVIGHHLKFQRHRSLEPRDSGTLRLGILTGHRDFTETLAVIGELLSQEQPPAMADRDIQLLDALLDGLPEVERLLDEAQSWWDSSDEETRRFAAAVAALVVSADVCGSMLARAGHSPIEWAEQMLGTRCDGADLAQAAGRRLGGADPRPFQREVAASSARVTLVTAGCGSGKTVAAYLWAAERLADRKLFFCYPTTGTATEGFADYAFPEFEQDAALVHSRAEADIERILDNGAAEDGSRAIEGALKYRGLELWRAKVTICTADAVLGLVQNNRVGLFGFPAIAGAGFVFDEIHLYDDRMFGVLLAFLEAFRGAPILLMTATLQPSRRAALRALAASLGDQLEQIGGPRELEELERYEIAAVPHEVAFERAVSTATSGERVLWVANTVDRAIKVAQAAEQRGVRVEPYHSRYRYRDRLERHAAVIDAFKRDADTGGVLAVTTQVCEVSLDISANLLVSELAPASALIQRLGRLNRWATPEETPGPRPALIVEPPNSRPYNEEEIELGRHWLAGVLGGPCSQRNLAAAFMKILRGRRGVERTRSAWLDEGWTIEPTPVREGSATIMVVRMEDRDECLDDRRRPDASKITRYGIPMPWGPVSTESRGWEQLGGAVVAPKARIGYSERWGATWAQ